MKLPIFQVDAFAERLFHGNPAAIVPLKEWLPDDTLGKIAMENNLSETAFFVETASGYELRWFTPTHEVTLCGHATLATAFVIFRHFEPSRDLLTFATASGELKVEKEGDLLWLDFPTNPVHREDRVDELAAALGARPIEVVKTALTDADSDKIVAVFESARVVAELRPDIAALGNLEGQGVVATAPGVDGIDFVSRYFAPNIGLPEDPVTGATHCAMTPYWADRFDKTRLVARQLSSRGGELVCELHGERVRIGGRAQQYLQGTISI